MVHRNVIVSGKIPLSVNYMVKPFELVSLVSLTSQKLKFNLIFRLKNNLIYFNTPRYIFMNSKVMFACIYRDPTLKDISFPVLLDIYRLNDIN